MSIGQVAAGQLLDGRYRLIAPLPADRTAAIPARVELWRACDEALARDVAICLLPLNDPRAGALRLAARTAGRLTDPALVRVYDVADDGQVLFVVSELLDGDTLEQRLRSAGAQPAEQAADIVAEIARALTSIHAIGLAHGRLRPESIELPASGEARLAGLGITAALAETQPSESEAGPPPEADADTRADERDLGCVLYAALTARWPGDPGASALPPPPLVEGRPCSPRQIRAGVPRDLDSLVMRMLGGLPATDVVTALEPFRHAPEAGHPFEPATTPNLLAELTGGPAAAGTRRRGTAVRVLLPVAVVAIALAVGGALWPRESDRPAPVTTPPAANHAVVEQGSHTDGTPIAPALVRDYDPLGDGEEHPEEIGASHDGNPQTAWHTSHYTSANLGGSKPGVGLLVDLGRAQNVAAVHIDFGRSGTSFELRAGDRAARSYSDLAVLAADSGASDAVTVRLPPKTKARYWLVWLTSLPQVGTDDYQGAIAEISFTG